MNTHDDRWSNTVKPGVNPVPDEFAMDARGTGETNENGSQLTLPLCRENDAMSAREPSEVDTHDEIMVGAQDALPASCGDHGEMPLGQRLAAAREHLGWSHADVATRLKLPVNLIARLEGDDYTGLTEGIFLRGYLLSYARLVGVPDAAAIRIAAAHSHAAPLVATGTISRSRYLFDRYSVSATYLVLTAIIVVPAVWLATHGGLQQNLARTTLLDPQPNVSVISQATAPAAGDTHSAMVAAGVATNTASAEPPDFPQADPSPVIASMAPFPSEHAAIPAAEPVPLAAPSAEAIGSGAHTLDLKLAQQSWVEITGPGGQKIEYAMLAAGSEHTYRSDGPVSILLGNAQGAEMTTDGTAFDMTPFQRGNVAHIKLFGAAAPSASRSDQ
jgi:cytoskeleton protein RodZ